MVLSSLRLAPLQPEEGPLLIQEFLESVVNVRRDPLHNVMRYGISDMVTSDGDLRTFPHFLADQGEWTVSLRLGSSGRLNELFGFCFLE